MDGTVTPEQAGVDAIAPDEGARQRLLLAATRLFARTGYAATSVREIVEAAGVTKPVLYYYFQSKEGLYLAILEETTRIMDLTIAEAVAVGGSACARIEGLLERMVVLVRVHIDTVRLVYSVFYGPPQGAPPFDFEAFHHRLVGAVRRLVVEGMANGELRPGDADDVTWALLGAFEVANGLELHHPDLHFGADGQRRLLTLIFDGVRAATR
jgi:TetR/AcrR family transcriptional regulator